ncbi:MULTISPECIES: branched-chain amino acid ABC transporter permease [Saliphagus]|uniref:Branched-chain amino acid ABC transporter permease n=1 Tax=Saliphagus infecundisoli TaxID=1849069 RepID=A0ABD5QF63_9EURY|nr:MULTISPECIES: branched-chain amino acid ABC transporter permease [Saliphagus]
MSTVDLGGGISRLTSERTVRALVVVAAVVLALDLVRRIYTGSLTLGTLGFYLWNGIVDGLVFGLAGIGLSMTYSILRFANFSHGDLLTTGAFSGWTVAYLIAGAGIADTSSRLLLRADGGAPPGQLDLQILGEPIAILAGLVVAALLTVLIALAIDRVVYRPLRDAGGIPLLIASVGVALALRYFIALVYTSQNRAVTASSPEWSSPVFFWTEGVNVHELTMVVSATVLMVGIHLLLQYTKLGTSMRAMADNRDLALITGIPTERVVRATWMIGAGLAGVAGYLIVLDRGTITINLGWFLLLLIFAAVILGGIGSIYGAIVGALIIGLTINVSLVWIPSDMNEIAAFGLMILVLLVRPQGLFGGVETA